MKKFFVSILALVYFTISVRANVHLHDCLVEFKKPLTDKSCKKENSVCCEDIQQLHLDICQKIAERGICSFSGFAKTIASSYSDYSFVYIFFILKELLLQADLSHGRVKFLYSFCIVFSAFDSYSLQTVLLKDSRLIMPARNYQFSSLNNSYRISFNGIREKLLHS